MCGAHEAAWRLRRLATGGGVLAETATAPVVWALGLTEELNKGAWEAGGSAGTVSHTRPLSKSLTKSRAAMLGLRSMYSRIVVARLYTSQRAPSIPVLSRLVLNVSRWCGVEASLSQRRLEQTRAGSVG